MLKSASKTEGKSTTDAAIEDAARDYAAYVSVDLNSQLKGMYDAVDEMQLRLEEFTSIVEMLQTQTDKSIAENMPRFEALKPHINHLCKRIDALDIFVERVNHDLAIIESNMEVVESSLGPPEPNKLAKLNPFSYFKKSSSPEPPVNPSPRPTFQHIEIFKTDDYFKKEEF